MKKIAIIGSGSWGVALATHLAHLGNEVRVWSYNKEECENINQNRQTKYLKDLEIHKNITCYTNFKDVVEDAEFILHVTPSAVTREVFVQYKEYINKKPVIICSKGFEKKSLKTLEEVMRDELPEVRIGVLTGPSHAEEVCKKIPTVLVIASEEEEVQKMVQDTFMCETMRIYTSNDVKGTELGGALKNIIAFCAGSAAALELGDNTFAALITRGLAEMTRLGVVLGGTQESFYGLSGLGDLIVTCMSEHSRNRKAGYLIGKGYTLEEVRKETGMVIESVENIEVAHKLGQIHGIEMPIVENVYDVLYNNAKPRESLIKLMTREKKSE